MLVHVPLPRYQHEPLLFAFLLRLAPVFFQVTYYSQLSGQSREKVALDLDRDNFLSAQEALEYGLVDRIVE